MKRCPQCHRVETDEALKFCRVDGATLVNDLSSEPQLDPLRSDPRFQELLNKVGFPR